MGTQVHNGILPQSSSIALEAPLLPALLKSIKGKSKKKLIRRTGRDYSQLLRRGYQFAFLLMNVWLGGQFYIWVRHFETGGQSAYVSRPAGVEGWLPIAGMMNLKYLLVHATCARPFIPRPCFCW